jgi:protein-tyrosine phosphatase
MKQLIILLFVFPWFATHAQIQDSTKRVVPVKGAVNFRDLGGYSTADGHQVKWNKVYRSAAINKLTDADMQIVAGRHIYNVVDFRGTEESKKAMDRLLPNTKYTLCPAGSENVGDWMKIAPSLTSGDSLMTSFYTNTEYFGDRYKPFFNELLQLPDTAALLFHCTAGKDRTGMGAALLLYALGVPKATIMQDYLATNTYRAAENEQAAKAMVAYMHVKERVANDMMAAKQAYLEATFEAIEKRYGSVNKFLTSELGLDKAKIKTLKAKYLEE